MLLANQCSTYFHIQPKRCDCILDSTNASAKKFWKGFPYLSSTRLTIWHIQSLTGNWSAEHNESPELFLDSPHHFDFVSIKFETTQTRLKHIVTQFKQPCLQGGGPPRTHMAVPGQSHKT